MPGRAASTSPPRLEDQVRACPGVEIWLRSTALAVFSDRKVGVLKDGREYVLVTPEILLAASGAREKNLAFPGNTLPGVYGAGAFQTLVNRDLVRPAKRLFIVGGGNVGLIAGYHALQAGIAVVGLVEAMPECGGYKVHRDKLARFGVPILTSHTIVSANGAESVSSVTVARVDDRFRPVPGTERSFACDTVLIAVGLDPVDEFTAKAREFGLPVLAAGDAEEIAEASAAIFSGKIRGLEAAKALGVDVGEISPRMVRHGRDPQVEARPDRARRDPRRRAPGSAPSCIASRRSPAIRARPFARATSSRSTRRTSGNCPSFAEGAPGRGCTGCEKCVAVCPGLAITLVDGRKDAEFPTVVIPLRVPQGRDQGGRPGRRPGHGGRPPGRGRGRRRQGPQSQRPDRPRQGPGAPGLRREDRRHPRPGRRRRASPSTDGSSGRATTRSSAAASGSRRERSGSSSGTGRATSARSRP